MKNIIVIGDYCSDTLVCEELRIAIRGHLNEPEKMQISYVDCTPTSSAIHAGYLLNQLARTEERYGIPHETVIFVNTDPRVQKDSGIAEAEGSKGVVIKLQSGLVITGPNTAYCFSFIKNRIEHLLYYPNLDKGSQFRSRDNYPQLIAYLAEYLDYKLEFEQLPLDIIPEINSGEFFVGHIDNYGNLKTTITKEDMKGKCEYGEQIEVEIGGQKHKATFVDSLFGGTMGELVIYPGSTGLPDNPFMEVSAWSHFEVEPGKGGGYEEKNTKTGKDFFNGVMPGMRVQLLSLLG